jgi:hypothetical protein
MRVICCEAGVPRLAIQLSVLQPTRPASLVSSMAFAQDEVIDLNAFQGYKAEAIELDHPLRIVKNRLWDGSGGAGEYRGGLGYEKIFEVVLGSRCSKMC